MENDDLWRRVGQALAQERQRKGLKTEAQYVSKHRAPAGNTVKNIEAGRPGGVTSLSAYATALGLSLPRVLAQVLSEGDAHQPTLPDDVQRVVKLQLLPEAVAAFKEWLFIGAWGKFSSGSIWKTFARAVKHARQAGVVLPDDLRPYDLRHTFLSWLLEMTGGDIMAVKEYAQHADMRSTLRYVQRGASARMVAAIETVTQNRATTAKTPAKR